MLKVRTQSDSNNYYTNLEACSTSRFLGPEISKFLTNSPDSVFLANSLETLLSNAANTINLTS